jgi:putative (di)nucleoside polyphosphate hydrolase
MDTLDRDKLPYRQGVVGVILNNHRKYLIVRSGNMKPGEWKFPSGGLEKGETGQQALLRELQEELGTNQYQVISQSKLLSQHDWPREVIQKRFEKDGKKYRGQQQQVFFLKYLGATKDIHPDPVEVRELKWVREDQLWQYLVLPNQKQEAELLLREFAKLL